MDVQTIFKRYELKYLLTKEQKDRLLEKLQENLFRIRMVKRPSEIFILIRRIIS